MQKIIFVGCRWIMSQVAINADLLGYEIVGILDHHYYGNTNEVCGIPVIGDERWLEDPSNATAMSWLEDCNFFPGNWWNGSQQLNDNGPNLQLLRLDRIRLLERVGARVPNLIHPDALPSGWNSKYASIELGKGIYFDSGCMIHADRTVIGDYCAFSHGTKLSGRTTIGKNVCSGSHAVVWDVNLGDNCYLGAHSNTSCYDTSFDKFRDIGSNTTIWSHAIVEKNVPANSQYTTDGRVLKKTKVLSEEELTIG